MLRLRDTPPPPLAMANFDHKHHVDELLAGALPPSLGELGPSLTSLYLSGNAITSVPTELAALTGLRILDLRGNQLTGVPAEFRTVDPYDDYDDSDSCYLSDNPEFSCANVGAGTSCCTGGDGQFGGNGCGEGLSGGPCYTG